MTRKTLKSKQLTLDHIRAIAEEVRYWAEKRAGKTNQELCGWCAKATAELWRRIRDEAPNQKMEIWMHRNDWCSHVYLMVEDHVVDVTATQFGEKEAVFIKHEKEIRSEYYDKTEKFADPKELIMHQKKTRWPNDQIAYSMPAKSLFDSPILEEEF